MLKISYKLTKRTTKTEKNENSFKVLQLYNFINFKTIRNKLTVKSLIQSLITSLWDRSAFNDYLKIKKKQKQQFQKKKLSEKCRGQCKRNFSL